jgi:histidinol-phosphatase (PHP family)
MMLFDSHVHTRFSADSDMLAIDALDAADREGLGLVFTEHIDFDYPGEMDFTFDPQAYWKEYENYRGQSLSLGVELGLTPGQSERSQAFIAQVQFDEVIGSIHLLGGKDFYFPAFYTGRSQLAVYTQYYTTMAAMVRENPFIDILGHIDYICRYAPYDQPGVHYELFASLIDEVLQAAIDTDTVLELNTRRFDDRLAMKELVAVYKRYYELGGRYVTIGSDAHKPTAIGASFALAVDFAAACHLQPVTFRERQRVILSV